MTLSKIQNPSIIFATNQQILARNLLISGIERDGRTDGRTHARTNIDFFEASYTKSPFGAMMRYYHNYKIFVSEISKIVAPKGLFV